MAQAEHDVKSLVQAILTRVQERQGYATKTKLFKYLYLVDVEWYRQKGCTFTGFKWIFYHYGPWSQEFDAMYAELQKTDAILVTAGNRPDLDTEFVRSSEPVELDSVIDEFAMERIVRDVTDTWADRRLNEMLDYVYFRTEPMESAEKGAPLDFTKITKEGTVSLPHRLMFQRKTTRDETVSRIQRSIAEKKAARVISPSKFTPPVYDDLYYEALQAMTKDAD